MYAMSGLHAKLTYPFKSLIEISEEIW